MNHSTTPSLLSIALRPKTPTDRQKLFDGLRRLTEEDRALRVEVDQHVSECTVCGMGERQLQIVVDRLKGECGVDVAVGAPRVIYQETFVSSRDGHSRRVLLEPEMRLELSGPIDEMCHAKTRLMSRRCFILSDVVQQGREVIRARMRLAGAIGLASELSWPRTSHVTHSLDFEGYVQVGGEGDDDGAQPIGVLVGPRPSPRLSPIALPEPDDFVTVQVKQAHKTW
jgi:translation elongation factor EF-G